MTLSMVLIRSGMTNSGKEGRLLGVQDEPLLEEECTRLAKKAHSGYYPEVACVYTSDLLRSRQTAALLYPDAETFVSPGLRAFDVGDFAGRQVHELLRLEAFRRWLSQAHLQACPGGERPYRFLARSSKAVYDIQAEMNSNGMDSAALVTHKMVIFEILRRFCVPRGRYLGDSIPYGGGYVMECNTLLGTARIVDKL